MYNFHNIQICDTDFGAIAQKAKVREEVRTKAVSEETPGAQKQHL